MQLHRWSKCILQQGNKTDIADDEGIERPSLDHWQLLLEQGKVCLVKEHIQCAVETFAASGFECSHLLKIVCREILRIGTKRKI